MPRADDVNGLRWAATTITAPLGAGVLPRPRPGRAALIAAWDEEAALDAFMHEHPIGGRWSDGWHVLLQPLGSFGSWSRLPELQDARGEALPDEPIAVLTLGRLRLSQLPRFLKATHGAERQAVKDPAMVASTGLARPPAIVATFSLWRTFAEMRDYAFGRSGAAHAAASRAHKERPFHHESLFVHMRPLRSGGLWDGRDPLAELVSGSAALRSA